MHATMAPYTRIVLLDARASPLLCHIKLQPIRKRLDVAAYALKRPIGLSTLASS